MDPKPLPIRGRGAAENPAGRFERLAYEADPDAPPDERPAPGTQFYRDSTRTIIATNDSPDVIFGASINPYRGCEHGCSYCLDGSTLILMADGRVRPLEELAVADAIYGTARQGWYRCYQKTEVLAHWRVKKPAYRVVLEDGTILVAGADHRFLTERGWKYVAETTGQRTHLTAGDQLMGFGGRNDASVSLEGSTVASDANLRVVAVESLGQQRWLFDITTATEDFIANGVVSHNCYARPYHEYLGLSPGLDFETKILVKEDAPALLRQELMAKKWQPQLLGISGVTDCYQPVERRLRLTRGCLEVLAEFRNPVSIVTKNALVARDADVLAELAQHECAVVFLSITTLDAELAGKLEPRASRPHARLEAIRTLAAAGVPVGVLFAPIIPGLNDHEVTAIVAAVAEAGGKFAGYTMLRLPLAVGPLFTEWLERHFPQRKDKVLGRVREMRGGYLNSARFTDRMHGKGQLADLTERMFKLACQQAGMRGRAPKLATEHFRRPGQPRGLFDDVP